MSTMTANLSLLEHNKTADTSSEVNTLNFSDLSNMKGKNLFTDMDTEFGKKLETETILKENEYIKFNIRRTA